MLNYREKKTNMNKDTFSEQTYKLRRDHMNPSRSTFLTGLREISKQIFEASGEDSSHYYPVAQCHPQIHFRSHAERAFGYSGSFSRHADRVAL